jgi:hypothetical protein
MRAICRETRDHREINRHSIHCIESTGIMNKSDEGHTIFWRRKDLYQYRLGFVSNYHPGKR